MADPSSGSFLAQPEFWVAASFVAFFVVVWKPLRSALVGGLDARAERIRKELDEAQRLREEAQTLLADFQRKQRDAIQEAETIVARARGEAERLDVLLRIAIPPGLAEEDRADDPRQDGEDQGGEGRGGQWCDQKLQGVEDRRPEADDDDEGAAGDGQRRRHTFDQPLADHQ